VEVHRGAGGLHDENIVSAHVVVNLNADLAIAELLAQDRGETTADIAANCLGKVDIGRAAQNLQVASARHF